MGKVAAALTVLIGVLSFGLAEGPQAAQTPLFMAITASTMALAALIHIYGPPLAD
jgi:hypothetical protein